MHFSLFIFYFFSYSIFSEFLCFRVFHVWISYYVSYWWACQCNWGMHIFFFQNLKFKFFSVLFFYYFFHFLTLYLNLCYDTIVRLCLCFNLASGSISDCTFAMTSSFLSIYFFSSHHCQQSPPLPGFHYFHFTDWTGSKVFFFIILSELRIKKFEPRSIHGYNNLETNKKKYKEWVQVKILWKRKGKQRVVAGALWWWWQRRSGDAVERLRDREI